jgi:hypothetical protein
MTLAAARDDQFLVEQDLHEGAAPMGGLLQDHDGPRQTVAVSHHVTIFVPEPLLHGHGHLPAVIWPWFR